MDAMRDGSAREDCYEIHYIREDALKLLLAGLGLNAWYGLFSDASGESGSVLAQSADKNKILADLYQNGIVDWDGSGVAVRQPYSAMLSVMLDKKVCVTVRFSDAALPLRCCYLSDTGVVLTQKSQREARTLGMAQLTINGWLHMLQTACIRLEEEECCTLTKHGSENGDLYETIRIQRDGIRSLRLTWDTDGGSLCCPGEELGRRLRERLCTDLT